MRKTKVCVHCKTRRRISQFQMHKTGYIASWCRLCKNANTRDWFKKNIERQREYKKREREKSPNAILKFCLKAALRRRLTKNSITHKQLCDLFHQQEGRCALSGLPLTWINGTGKPLPTSISIDRINSAVGYTRKNVRLVCFSINSFRQSMSIEELVAMAKAIVNYHA